MTNQQLRPEQLLDRKKMGVIISEAFSLASTGLLLMTIKIETPLFPTVILGIILFGLSILLLVSSLGCVHDGLKPFLTFMEMVMDTLWLSITFISLLVIVVTWVEGRTNIEPEDWMYNWYLWSAPVWLIVFTVIIILLVIFPIYFNIKKYGLYLTSKEIYPRLTLGLVLASLICQMPPRTNIKDISSMVFLGIVVVLSTISILLLTRNHSKVKSDSTGNPDNI
jgi:magnesium-transporting ATPase (P-type)